MSKSLLFAFFSLLPVIAFAAESEEGDVQYRKPLPTEEMEEYDQPPAPLPLWGGVESPGMDFTYGAFTIHQVNVNASGQNITGDAANEPSIAVDPTNHNNMVIGWRQFNSVSSNFRQSGYGYTNNGGNNWTFPSVLENNVFRSDPVLIADDIGRYLLLEPAPNLFRRCLDVGRYGPHLHPFRTSDWWRQTVVRLRPH